MLMKCKKNDGQRPSFGKYIYASYMLTCDKKYVIKFFAMYQNIVSLILIKNNFLNGMSLCGWIFLATQSEHSKCVCVCACLSLQNEILFLQNGMRQIEEIDKIAETKNKNKNKKHKPIRWDWFYFICHLFFLATFILASPNSI